MSQVVWNVWITRGRGIKGQHIWVPFQAEVFCVPQESKKNDRKCMEGDYLSVVTA